MKLDDVCPEYLSFNDRSRWHFKKFCVSSWKFRVILVFVGKLSHSRSVCPV